MIKAKMRCPSCGNEFMCRDLELFTQKNTEAWDMVKEFFEQLPKDAQEKIQELNNIKTAKQILKEKGCLRVVCPPCQSIMSWKAQKAQGIL